MKEANKAEERVEHQKSPKNKKGEMSDSQPSHSTISQKITDVNMKISTSLVASSQNDATNEKSPQQGRNKKRGMDTQSEIFFSTYERRRVKR